MGEKILPPSYQLFSLPKWGEKEGKIVHLYLNTKRTLNQAHLTLNACITFVSHSLFPFPPILFPSAKHKFSSPFNFPCYFLSHFLSSHFQPIQKQKKGREGRLSSIVSNFLKTSRKSIPVEQERTMIQLKQAYDSLFEEQRLVSFGNKDPEKLLNQL